MKKKSFAKINLILDVIEKRNDGYHNIDGIMQLIDLYDIVDVSISDEFKITSNSKDIPLDENNLVYKAYNVMKEKYNFKEKFKIHIEKNIPICAGIAGGSSNAAATIDLIDNLLKLKLSLKEKMDIARLVGADVSYLLMGKTARTRGIGDVLDEISPMEDIKVLIVNNGLRISTKYVYKNIKPSGKNKRVDELISYYENGEFEKFFLNLFNVMENISIKIMPEIQTIKEKMESFGAIKALMSGSGPTVFGIFKNDKDIDRAYKYFKNIYKNTFKTKTIGV